MRVTFSTYQKALPPQPIRIKIPGWAGSAQQMVNGAEAQPWHCLPFVEGSTYGLELIYQFETECSVVNDKGRLKFEWDYTKEPDVALTGGELIPASSSGEAACFISSIRG